MSTKDIIVGGFMGIGAILVGLTGFGVVDHYHDLLFFPLGVCSYMAGRILDRFWRVA